MSNGRANCILQVCCRTEAEATAALSEEMVQYLDVEKAVADKCAEHMIKEYDLAPKGSLGLFKSEVARLAREGHVKREGA
jgi:hypothetical protein